MPSPRSSRPTFAELGYACDPDPRLTPEEADENWVRLVGKDLVDDLRSLEPLRRELAEARALLANRDEALRQTAAERDWRQDVTGQLTAEVEWRRAVIDGLTAEVEWRRQGQAYSAARLADLQMANKALQEEAARLNVRLAPLEAIEPSALDLARRLQRLAARRPWSAVVRRLSRVLGAPAFTTPPAEPDAARP